MWVPTSPNTIEKYVLGFSMIKKKMCGRGGGRDEMIIQRNTENPSRKLAVSFNISCLPG